MVISLLYSPFGSGGYDISDYYNRSGTGNMDDMDELWRKLKKRYVHSYGPL